MEELVVALQEIMRRQAPTTTPEPFRLDTRFQLPKFSGKMNGEAVDSWIRSLSTYFRTCPDMEETRKLQIASLQLEGVAQAWWEQQVESTRLVVELGEIPREQTIITSWQAFGHALRERFYPPGYLQGVLARWLQLRKNPTQSVQAYIDVFCKLRIQLQVTDSEQVLIIKFNSGLAFNIRKEVDLFESDTLDQAFIGALAVERKVNPRVRNPPTRQSPHQASSSNPTQTPQSSTWCHFHKTSSHSAQECRRLKNWCPTPKTLLTEATPLLNEDNVSEEPIELDNPTEVDPSLLLMTTETTNSSIPLFTHNCQIKQAMATLILDNGSQRNLVSQELVNKLHLPTHRHPSPYQLGWVNKDGPQILVKQHCTIIFTIGPLRDRVQCDVTTLDFVDLLLGLPYQRD